MTKELAKNIYKYASPYIVMVLGLLAKYYIIDKNEIESGNIDFSSYIIPTIALLYTVFIVYKLSQKKIGRALKPSHHEARDYTKTKKSFSHLIKNTPIEVPDIYLTSFGNNYQNLMKCVGFNEYQTFLFDISNNNECVLHRYHIINDESQFKHVENLIKRNSNNSNCNIYIQIVTSLGIYDDVFLNFAVIDNSFAALTFENDSKIILSQSYQHKDDVQIIKDIVKSFSSQLLCVLKSGVEMKENIEILRKSIS